ncbi:Hypothetical predicted protein [Mytilus galloprovincialis]|uniref:Uncharacterized protein n=1 Tax=Mytilus galloprovincialis TaxID=29158 RepID=A0A8B6FP04_MYTGA|nr:Hypothetical predicted protein [Mytilus galloprovincialis]
MESQEEKVHQTAAVLCEAIVSVASFHFTLEQWEVVEVDIRAAEGRESELLKELVPDDTQCVDDILKDLGETLDKVEQQKTSMTAAEPTEKTTKDARYVFKDTVQNFDLNGAISKQRKREIKREKRKAKKQEKIKMKIAKEEEKVVQLYFKAVDNIMSRYSKEVRVQHKKEEKRRKQMEKVEKKALKMLEKEIKKREKECVNNEKKKPAQSLDLNKKHNDTKKSIAKKVTGNNKDYEKKEAHTVDDVETKEIAMKNRKEKKREEKVLDQKEKDSQTMDIKEKNIVRIDTTIDGKKNTFSANIRAFFQIFSCNKAVV